MIFNSSRGVTKNNSNPSVAIVDDETDFVKLLMMLFRRRDIPISFVAYDGREAVEKYKEVKEKPDVIIMDHHMRTMDGIETTRVILSYDQNSRIIFLSADSHIREEALKAGACAFLNKPAGVNDIIRAIRSCDP
jgi:two-component system chemotaxis response regulator CheY